MVASLLSEEKRTYSEDSDVGSQHEIALFSKEKMRRTKGSTCYHSKKPFVVADQRCLVT
jgi:hypothetical protein